MATSGECYCNILLCCHYFSSSSVVLCAFSAVCVYLKFGHQPHPLGFLCVKFCSFAFSIAELAHREKSITQSLTRLFDAPGTGTRLWTKISPQFCYDTQKPSCLQSSYINVSTLVLVLLVMPRTLDYPIINLNPR